MSAPVHMPMETPPDEVRPGDLVHTARAWFGALWLRLSGTPTEIDWEDGEPEAAFAGHAERYAVRR